MYAKNLALPLPVDRSKFQSLLIRAYMFVFAGLLFCLTVALPIAAQTGGQGALEGTVTDTTGAVIPNYAITATNQDSKVDTTRKGTGAGSYSISPLIPGVYTITIKAEGFATIVQKNVEVNGLTATGFNAKMDAGSTTQEVTVTTAPAQLQTTTASVQTVITDEVYESLPIVMNNQQRDPTALATLSVGAQGGARTPIFSGTGNYLAEMYIDGIPATTANQQGDNRVASNGIPVEAVDQLQIVSSGPSAEYQGAGAIGLTIKSGGKQYHGQIVDVVRNTAFDTWGFGGNQLTTSGVVNGVVVNNLPAGKPVEHQNELSASVGGPIPFTRHKGFFFANWDQYHGRQGVSPASFTVPTSLMKQGDFTELQSGVCNPSATGNTNCILFNPLTSNCTSSTACTRQPFAGNILPQAYLSPISLKEQSFLPDPNLPGLVNNFVTTGVSGYDNHELTFKVDYDWSQAQRFSFVYSHGVRQSAGYGATLPLPYVNGDSSVISPTMLIAEHSWTITPRLVNQFKYGFTRFPQPVLAPTDGLSQYSASTQGITGLPAGQAAGNFPGTSFGTSSLFSTAPYQWTENGAADATHNVVPNAFSLVDNLQWIKGKHNMTFGVQTQWLEDNVTSQSSPSGIFVQNYVATSTSNFGLDSKNNPTATLDSTKSGYSYASFLLGAVNSSSTSVPLFFETGGRFHPWSPYFQDDWKILPNLTINLGLRWDYLPPYHEAQDRWSFFNPNATNPLTGTMGELQYAGNRGADISCQCRTPVQTYWKNFGPRLGLEYSPDPKTVFRAGYAIAYSRAGGVGGRAGDSTGAGQTGFGSSFVLPAAVNVGATAGPSYYLNNGAAFQAAGLSNTNFGGAGFSIPTPTGPSASQLTINTGNYTNAAGAYVTAGGAPTYADPYLSGRAPEFVFYNAAMQKALTNNLTFTLGYSGSQSHFVAGAGVPGAFSGQLDPSYITTLGNLTGDKGASLLNSLADPANVATAMAADPRIKIPYNGFVSSASTAPTIGRMIRPYQQYSGVPSPQWDNIGNLSYNALQIMMNMREWKGINITANYTYSRNVGDDGTTRSGFAVPAAASSNGTAIAGNNRADRDIVITDIPQNLNIYGYVKSPFGRNKIGSNNWAVRAFAGGWQVSPIFTYTSGTPILITGTGCNTPSSGTCMPDVDPLRLANRSIRINGGYGGPGVTYANFKTTHYIDNLAFTPSNCFLPAGVTSCSASTAITKIGDSPRSHLDMWSPSKYNIDAAVQRSFNITKERVKFILRADCFDVTNKVTFTIGQTQTVSVIDPRLQDLTLPVAQQGKTPSSFGQLSSYGGSRKWQFQGRLVF